MYVYQMTDATVHLSSLSLLSKVLTTILAPKKIIDHILTHPDDSLLFHQATKPLTDYQQDLLSWHVSLGYLCVGILTFLLAIYIQ